MQSSSRRALGFGYLRDPAAHRVAVVPEFFAEPLLEVRFLERPDGVVPHQRAQDRVGDDEP
jgi:hypothetical protein